jgi:lipopolysaccharide export system permease protein
MLRPSTLDRYVLRETAGPLAFGLGLLTFALVAGRMLKLTEMVINRGVGFGEVMKMVGYIMPAFLELTFPMAVLLGVLLGFGRMSSDRELTAARACGISLYRLSAPVLAMALMAWAISSWLAFSVRPWANSQLRETLLRLTRTRATAGLQEKIFNKSFPGLVLYVDTIDPGDEGMRGVLIADSRNPRQSQTIIAQRGLVIPDQAEEAITLRLFDGSIFGVDADTNGTHVTSFRIYDLNIHPDAMLGLAPRVPEEMDYRGLRREIAQSRARGQPNHVAEAELARKYTLPLAAIMFALLGVSLGLKPARGGQSERFGVSVALFFLYYVLLRAGQTLAERGILNAFVAMGIPDVAFAVLAVWLFQRAAQDRGDQGRGAGDMVWDFVERLERRKAAA